jgi:hypothetical protein
METTVHRPLARVDPVSPELSSSNPAAIKAMPSTW